MMSLELGRKGLIQDGDISWLMWYSDYDKTGKRLFEAQ